MQSKTSIVSRMIAWFLVLALIPLGVVVVFVQQQINQTIRSKELQIITENARLFASESANHPDTLNALARDFGAEEIGAFIVGANGAYIAHSDSHKAGALASEDFPPEIVQKLLSGEEGTIDDSVRGQIIGYAPIAGQEAVAVLLRDNQDIESSLNTLASSVFWQLSVSLLITTIVSGLAILAIISPLRQLAIFADRVGSGDLDATLDVEELEGEIATLGNSLKGMTIRLRESINTLEQRVSERTRDLDIASNVSKQITRVLDLNSLLPQLVEETRKGFDLYFVSVFLYDLRSDELLLAAGTGEEGEKMKAEAQAFYITTRPSLVAQAARDRVSVVINDVRQSENYFLDPHLPDTASEAAFPMLIGEHLVGVLDLQSRQKDFFDLGEIQIFATLSEQIAVAVRNAELYGQQQLVAEELRRADQMKMQFLSSMSHELRTPLNAIINLNQLVAMEAAGPVTEEQNRMLETVLSSSRHLLQLINDVLDITKIQAGKLVLYVEEAVNLNEEIRTVLGIAQPLLEKQNALLEQSVQFIQDVDGNLPLMACDRRRVRQILLNLLSNAIKFTEQGSVTLSVKMKTNEILFAVLDTGPGVPEDLQVKIFEPFVQTLDGIKYAQGTGLGLPISYNLAQAHGGDLWLESKAGEGASFFFNLPLQPLIKKEE